MIKSLFLSFTLLLSSCAEIISAPKLVFEKANGAIDLSEKVSGDWSRVCALPPYSTNKHAEKLLGFKFDVESKTDIFSSDSISLLIFVKANSVTNYYEVSRGNVDFSSLKATCYQRTKAIFKLNNRNGWVSAEHT